MSTTDQQETEVVTGTVIGTVQKASDKWQVEVLPDGRDYGSNPRRLWTKDPNVPGQMAGLIGQRLSFMCGVSNWTNNQGQPVRSLWLNGYGQPGAAPMGQQAVASASPQPQAWQPAPTGPVPTPQAQPAPAYSPAQAQDDRELKIHRQTASKVAVNLLRFLLPEQQTFANLLAISERLVAYYDHGAPGTGQGSADWGDGASVPTADDDIPF